MPNIFDTIEAEEKKTTAGNVFDEVEAEEKQKKRGFFELFTAGAVAEQETQEALAPHIQRQGAKLLPFIGDIGLTATVPQVGIPLKAGRGAKAGLQLLNLFRRSTAAGAGSFAGSAAEQQIREGEVDLGRAAKEGLIGFAGEPGLSLVLGTGKFALRQSANIAKDITILGGKAKKIISSQLIENTTTRANKFVEEIAPDIIRAQQVPGAKIGDQVSAAMDENKLAYGRFKDVLVEAVGGEKGKVLIDDLSQFLADSMEATTIKTSKNPIIEATRRVDGVIKDLGFTTDSPQARQLRKIMVGGLDSITPNEVEFIFTNVFPKKTKAWFKLTPDTRRAREELKDALINDMGKITSVAGETAADIKKASDDVFKAIKEFQVIESIYKKAVKIDDVTGAATIRPQQLADSINRNKKFFQQSMSKEAFADVWPKLKAEADFYEGIAKRLKLGETESGFAAVSQFAGPGTSIALGALGGGPGTAAGVLVGAELFGAASAWALLSDSGRAAIKFTQKVPTKEALKIPFRLGARETLNQPDREGQVGTRIKEGLRLGGRELLLSGQ
ncbi:MAG: hypothetical protein JRD68_00115 [Deltaproteobacteria bacterium]|nr:hypothetical protein [Deltaproteobacteria bacterium]